MEKKPRYVVKILSDVEDEYVVVDTHRKECLSATFGKQDAEKTCKAYNDAQPESEKSEYKKWFEGYPYG